jgi:aryl-alcohol dehydrogenase-like predicted oxidoreductase
MLVDADRIARENGWARFVTLQNHYSLLERKPEGKVLPACQELGIGFLPYFPLANGLLTGKYRRGEAPPEGTRLAGAGDRAEALLSDDNFDRVDRLTAFAEERGHTILELAIAWLASQPVMASVIAGATKPEQVQANASAAAWQLSADEVAQVRELAV